MGDKDPTYYFLRGHITLGSWDQEQSWNLNLGIPIFDVGAPKEVLTAMANVLYFYY